MSWLEQVLHVVTKDVRQGAWAVALALAALLAATGAGLGAAAIPPGDEPMSRSFLTQIFFGAPLFYLAGALLVAVLVHGDSPSRSDADWVYRPLFPSAVLAAKLVVVAVLLLLLPLGAQFVILGAHGVGPAQMPALLGSSAWVQLGLLGMVLAAAALTPDLKTYLLTLMLGAVAWEVLQSLVTWTFSGSAVALSGVGRRWLPLLWVVAGGSVALLQYRTRNTRRSVAFLLPVLLLGLTFIEWTKVGPMSSPGVPEPLRAGPLEMALVTIRPDDIQPVAGGWVLQLEVSAPAAPRGYRYHVTPELTLVLADGTQHPLRSYSSRISFDRSGSQGEGIRWRDGDPPHQRPGVGTMAVSVPPDLMDAVRRGGTRLVLGGSVFVSSPQALDPTPLEVGASTRSEGMSIEILSVGERDGGPFVVTGVREVTTDRTFVSFSPWDMVDVALVDRDGEEGVRLTSRSGGGPGTRPLVLLGVQVRNRSVGLVPRMSVPSEGDGSPPWWRDGTLLVTAWRALGAYPVPETSLDLRIASRVIQVRRGEPTP